MLSKLLFKLLYALYERKIIFFTIESAINKINIDRISINKTLHKYIETVELDDKLTVNRNILTIE